MKKLMALLMVGILLISLLATSFVSAANDDSLEGASEYLKGKFKVKDAAKEFKKLKVTYDELGFKHVKLQQMIDNIPVYGSEFIVHFDNYGNVYHGNGRYSEKAKAFKGKGQYIKAKEAIEAAKKEVGFSEEVLEDGQEMLQEDIFNAELYLYEVNGEYIPVYVAKINWLHNNSFGDWRVFVNAYDGSVVDKYNNIKAGKGKPGGGGGTGTNATGTGTGVLGDTKTINLLLSSGTYYLHDKTRTQMSGILTYDANNRTRLPGTLMTDTDTTWDSSRQRAAVDAHYYAAASYDYYYSLLGRNSIDNKGMAIKSTVHYSRDYVNAFWNGYQMVYGDGDNYYSIELSGALDVVAHELSHGVTDYESNLEYRNQSGALNEAFSDILGAAVEFAVQPGKADWLIGEDVWTPGTSGDALRSMEDPTLYGDPAHMDQYVYTTDDNGGVHTNSGIPNKAAYLIGSSIGTDKMAKIFYRANAVYWIMTTDFSQGRAGCLQAAADLYGINSTEYNAVANGFSSVGIY
ncbi:MAG: M4 family metallopeptidase [Bacillota bacterium]